MDNIERPMIDYDKLSDEDKQFYDMVCTYLGDKFRDEERLGRKVEMMLPIYTITMVEKIEDIYLDDGRVMGLPEFGDTYTAGFYYTKQFAVEALCKNIADIKDYVYDYAVIEKYEPCVLSFSREATWFKWDEEKEGFLEIETPELCKHICNVAS